MKTLAPGSTIFKSKLVASVASTPIFESTETSNGPVAGVLKVLVTMPFSVETLPCL
ncbi:hypothetical protein ACHSBP_18980 [Pseudoalteromonas sp. XMcav1-K]|uniref:hypothetical protein n=1 Tax=Pseudoalteromonas sp. XMcav1-K TaxID=3374372 RepID=UPI00375747C7